MLERIFLGLIALMSLAAQTAELELGLSRDWGYGGFDNSIQGRFSLHAGGPENLVEVRFRMDGAVINVDTAAPFRFQFETDAFEPGLHTMSATGILSDGSEIGSREITGNFLSAEEAGGMVKQFVLPLLAVLGVVILAGVAIPLLTGRRRTHVPGVYGAAGGAVCPRCNLPFSRSMLAPNMILGKLERCPHCGKWSIVPRAGAAALEAAESRLAGEGAINTATESEEEKRRRLLEDSRFNE